MGIDGNVFFFCCKERAKKGELGWKGAAKFKVGIFLFGMNGSVFFFGGHC